MKISDFSEKIDLKKADMGDVVKDFYKSDAPQFIGKTKKKRRQMAIAAKLSANESTGDLHDRLYDLEAALRSAREITKQIKYADTHMTVIGELEALAEKVGLKLDDYDVRQVYQANNSLESAVYELEAAFEEAIRDIQNEIDDAEYEESAPEGPYPSQMSDAELADYIGASEEEVRADREGAEEVANDKSRDYMHEDESTYECDDEFFEAFGWIEDNLEEAEYRGRKVKLNKPMQGDVKKFKVYVKDPKTGNVKKVNFGHGGSSVKGKAMKIRKSNPKARKSFRARHNCDNPGPKTKARYWSCRKW